MKEALEAFVADTRKKVGETADYYGLPREQIEPRHWAKCDKILEAKSMDEARLLAGRATQSIMLTCLAAWADRKIPGPKSADNITRKARQAERLAKFQEKLGNTEAAAKQLKKASILSKQAAELRVEEERARRPERVAVVERKPRRKPRVSIKDQPVRRRGHVLRQEG